MTYFPLLISAIKRETIDCQTVLFKLPLELKNLFSWQAGQYVQVKFDIKGEEQTRCFSITSMPGSETLALTVKSNGKGGVSDYMNQLLEKGQRVNVSLPLGQFSISPDVTRHTTYYFIAAGSGITPIYNMVLTLLTQEPFCVVNLLYGTRNQELTIFWKQLHDLQLRFEERLHLNYCFSETDWFGYHPWAKGRIDQEMAQSFIQEFEAKSDDVKFYLCGPGDFIDNLNQGLLQLGMRKEQIFFERYQVQASEEEASIGMAAELLLDLAGHEYHLQVKPGQTLLACMQQAGLPVPYSCQSGVCGTCVCQLLEGDVTMLNNIALDESQLTKRKILACQSLATTKQVRIHYD